MLSPMLAFTSDEAWELIPGVAKGSSVHESDWEPKAFVTSGEEKAIWQSYLGLREQVLPELEKARQSKLIGKALEAQLALHKNNGIEANGASTSEVLRELLNVSQLKLAPSENGAVVSVSHAEGQKCERCWHWENDVGSNSEHPTLCDRCVQAVAVASKNSMRE